MVAQLQNHLAGNPGVVKQLKWSTELAFVEQLVDSFNAQVCAKMGWTDYILTDGLDPKSQPRSNNPWWAPALAVAAGAATLKDWFGAGGKPVAKEAAEARAAVCAGCPKNAPGEWSSFFTVPAADFIRKMMNQKRDMALSTSQDDSLNVCSACYCPLKLKVWTPIEHIKERMPEVVRNDLAPECWVLKEIK